MGDFRVSFVRRLCLVAALVVARAVATGLGRCPVYPPPDNFELERMSGTWYEVERSFYLAEIAASCTELHVSLNDKGYLLISVKTRSRWTGAASWLHGLGVPARAGAASFRYKQNNRMPYALARLLPGAGHYAVLATDYRRFALVWSCTSLTVAHTDRIWVLGRTRELEAAVRAEVYGAMAGLRLDPDRLILSKNNNCSLAPPPLSSYDSVITTSTGN